MCGIATHHSSKGPARAADLTSPLCLVLLLVATGAAAQVAPGPDGASKIGNGVTGPTLISKVEPEYADRARKASAQGTVVVSIVVRPDGTASDFKIVSSLGYGLDEKAIDAIRRWRFKPGTKDGKPVAGNAIVDVNFRMQDAPVATQWYSGPMGFQLAKNTAPPLLEDGSMPKPLKEELDESAVLEFVVDAKGAVREVHAISGSPAATDLLQKYLSGWKFRPAVDGDKFVEATGRVRFIKGKGDEAVKRPLFEARSPAPPIVAPNPASKLPAEALLGEYRREPMLNPWHHGVIELNTAAGADSQATLRWKNDAGVAWTLSPDLQNGVLQAGSENPYYNSDPQRGRTFRIRLRDGEVDGFEFLGDFFAKVSVAPARALSTANVSATSPAHAHTLLNSTDGQTYVWIPPGAFMMGCSEGDTECFADEKPHSERIAKGFWLGQTEVTQAAYQKVAGANPSAHKGDQFPVEKVTWEDAAKYCSAIGERLPTEVEWEYAARAGSAWARYGNLDDVAWYARNSGGATHAVGMKLPNAFGLFDMLGNVLEWVSDSYPGSELKLDRGGNAFGSSRDQRASRRGRNLPASSFGGVGFRCAGDFPEQAIQVAASGLPLQKLRAESAPAPASAPEPPVPPVESVPAAASVAAPPKFSFEAAPAPDQSKPGQDPDTRPPGAVLSAREILDKVSEVYARLTSIRVSAKTEDRQSFQGQLRGLVEASYELSAQGRDHHFMKVKLSGDEETSASDGQNTWKAVSARKHWSQVEAATVTATEAPSPEPSKNDLYKLIAGRTFAEIPRLAAVATEVEIVREADCKLASGRVACYVLRLQRDKVEEELWVDKARFLVLERVETMRSQAATQTMRMKLNSIEVNQVMPESAFRFEPASGWTQVETVLLRGEQGQPLVGNRAARFALKTLDGQRADLAAAHGKVVVLDFWATWCGPCRQELPVVEKLRKEFAGQVVVYGVNAEDPGTVKDFLRKNQYELTVLMDSNRQVNNLYGVSGLPTLVIIDKQGIVRKLYLGSRDEATLRKAIRSVVESD